MFTTITKSDTCCDRTLNSDVNGFYALVTNSGLKLSLFIKEMKMDVLMKPIHKVIRVVLTHVVIRKAKSAKNSG